MHCRFLLPGASFVKILQLVNKNHIIYLQASNQMNELPGLKQQASVLLS
jgi:hypothetical protein